MRTLKTITILALVALGGQAIAQPAQTPNAGGAGGVAGGAAAGAVGGAVVGGPVGAAVGGVAGAVAGGLLGSLAAPDREYVTTYVRTNRHPSARYQGDLAVGAELPTSVQIYEVPARNSVRGYHYAYVNDRPVLLQNRRIVEIVE